MGSRAHLVLPAMVHFWRVDFTTSALREQLKQSKVRAGRGGRYVHELLRGRGVEVGVVDVVVIPVVVLF